MQLDPQVFLKLCEGAKTLCFFDIEATGLRGDYNSVLVVSVRPFDGEVRSFAISQPGNDQRVVREAKKELESYECWCGYFSKGFDIPMLNTRLLKWGQPPIQTRPHIDMYYTLKANVLTARRSQAHLLEWLDTPEKKLHVGADMWNKVLSNPRIVMPKMVERCESDTAGLQDLYKRTRHLIKEIKT